MAAIPKINAAKNTDEYAAAVQSMLEALGDPATRVIRKMPVDSASSSRERQPAYRFTSDSVMVVTVNNYQDLADFFGAREKIMAIMKELPKARGLLFDLRARRIKLVVRNETG